MSKNVRKQLALKHKDALPIANVITLPPFSLNPVSIVYLLYKYLTARVPQLDRIVAELQEESRSVIIRSQEHADRLWSSGFFGKGCFSRSEMSWYIRTQRALGLIGIDERLTPEEITARRRKARAQMKSERAKAEREALERILISEGKTIITEDDEEVIDEVEYCGDAVTRPIPNLEIVQLTLHESLFLASAIDAIDIYDEDGMIDRSNLLSRILPLYDPEERQQFMIQMAVYHHYRSRNWVVKSGIKFGVDWLLYRRGPVFSHAEYAIITVPRVRGSTPDHREWWWLHALSRVNSQVKKIVMVVYVEYDPAETVYPGTWWRGIYQHELSKFKVKEVSIRRWIPGKNRD